MRKGITRFSATVIAVLLSLGAGIPPAYADTLSQGIPVYTGMSPDKSGVFYEEIPLTEGTQEQDTEAADTTQEETSKEEAAKEKTTEGKTTKEETSMTTAETKTAETTTDGSEFTETETSESETAKPETSKVESASAEPETTGKPIGELTTETTTARSEETTETKLVKPETSNSTEGTANRSESADTTADSTAETTIQAAAEPEMSAADEGMESTAETQPERAVVKGGVEVLLTAGIRVLRDQIFTVDLYGPETRHKDVTLAYQYNDERDERASQALASFEGLEPGKYVVNVSSKGYVTYTQEIEVTSYTCKLQIYTGAVSLDGIQPGILAAGDFNGDNQLGADDRDLLVDAIYRKVSDSLYDLNKDEKVDLLDLQYFTRYYGEKDLPKSTQENKIPADAVQAAAKDGTKLNGDLSCLFTEEGEISLSNDSGQPITSSNPVSLGFDFAQSNLAMDGLVIQMPKDSENRIAEATIDVIYMDESGKEVWTTARFTSDAGQAGTARLMSNQTNGTASVASDGAIIVDLKGKVAVKRVIITITKTTSGGSLADISKVEFLNNLESRIPEPSADIPAGLAAEPGNKRISLTWQKARNVTAYEVSITCGEKTETRRTTDTSLQVMQFDNDELKNNEKYEIRVRSLNGEWKSAYSGAVTAIPKADRVPQAPQNVQAEGGFRCVNVRWNAPEDGDTCNVYYKKDGEESFQKITGIEGTAYRIDGLEDNTKYLVYVTGVNEVGEGPASEMAGATTLILSPVEFPQYRIITAQTEPGQLLEHVKTATRTRGVMNDSPLDGEDTKTALGVVDGNFASYCFIEDWDEGVEYHDNYGITVELDQEYTMDRFTFAAPDNGCRYSRTAVHYWDAAQGKEVKVPSNEIRLSEKKDANGRVYYVIKLAEPVTTSRVRLGFSRYARGISVAEIRFYEYDSLEADILALYEDDLHLVLRSDVTESDLDELEARLDIKQNGEYHPDRTLLQRELEEARLLLGNGTISDVVEIHTQINSASDSKIALGGLNTWQPLGISASAGDEVVIYVGHPTKKTGENSDLYLIATQYHTPANDLSQQVARLTVGRNVVTIPQITTAEREKGGSLYISYGGSNASEVYAVRADGGVKIPVLDLYRVSDEAERTKRIQAYTAALEQYVNGLEALHAERGHEYQYEMRWCTANSTEIMLDYMLLSLPATQICSALKVGSGDMAANMAAGAKAMDEMLTLFYQHKGLAPQFAEGTPADVIEKNHLPNCHLNIRYMQMAGSVFMYAAGNHVGVQWNETRNMVSGRTPQIDENGKLISGTYLGWGTAHEIGHQINQGAYAHAEVTNNYFAMLAKSDDTNKTFRTGSYKPVYEKVTSGSIGHASNVAVQLAMYWQLHLAYDSGYNFKRYDNYQEIFDNLFFARVDSYVRDPEKAPSPGGVKLTLDGNADQNLMRLSSAAAKKDLTEFFIRWGMVIDDKTAAYMGQFDPEERAIYYVCEDARAYKLTHSDMSGSVKDKDVVTQANVQPGDGEITLTMNPLTEAVLGYEIVRITIVQGKEQKEVVGFATENTFIDSVGHLGNRAVCYEVTAIDQYLNRSNIFRTESVKTEGDGVLSKTGWTIESNMVSAQDQKEEAGEDSSCEDTMKPGVAMLIDGSRTEVYTGAAEEDPYILLSMNPSLDKLVSFCGVRLAKSAGISGYKIEISTDGENFKTVKEGSLDAAGTFLEEGDAIRLYFTAEDAGETDGGDRIASYDAAFVKFTAVGKAGQEISLSELDLVTLASDNVEFFEAGDAVPAIGLLEEDYIYQKAEGGLEEKKIPAGSLVFTGTYMGHPAFNVVILYDEKGNIVGGTNSEALVAEQIILADDPGNAMLGEVSDGIWIYWIAPDDLGEGFEAKLPSKVRAELYRVDDALTNEGARQVSDTLLYSMPSQLPPVILQYK